MDHRFTDKTKLNLNDLQQVDVVLRTTTNKNHVLRIREPQLSLSMSCFNRIYPHIDIKANGVLLNEEVFDSSKYIMIERVIFNDPVTVVIWKDGTKTIVRCQNDDIYDPEKGLAMCVAKKMLGNNGNYYDIFHKYLDEYKEDEVMKKKLAKAVKKNTKKGKKK